MVLDALSFLEKSTSSKKVSILGVPLDLGKDAIGTDKAPEYVRSLGLTKMCEVNDISYTDLGNVSCPTRKNSLVGNKKAKYLRSIAEVGVKVAKIINEEIVKKNTMVVLGGDHALSIGTISGASAATGGDLGVIWIDAHGDMMTHKNTLSGNIHGMPSAAIMGFGEEKLVNLYKDGRKVDPKNMLYLGLKDLDQGEIDLIREEKLCVITIYDILQNSFKNIFEEIENLQKRVSNIWVSLDVDSIDKEFSPGTPMPNSGGLTYREITSLCRYIGKTCNVIGMDIVEIAPDLDVDQKTGQLAVELIAELLGKEYDWYTQYMNQEEEKQQIK